MISKLKKENIAIEVIKTLFSRFENFPEDSLSNRNAPFHEAFLEAFSDRLENKVTNIPMFISLSSWLHGLNTTLGQSFFENIAQILSDGYKREFTRKRGTLLKVSRAQKQLIADIITDLKNSTETPDLNRENSLIFSAADEVNLDANSFTADVYIESNEKIVAIELKSVKPNAGEMRGEKQKILEAKSALYNEFSGKKIRYYIGFPFDPNSDTPTNYDKHRFLDSIIDGSKYFALEEVLLASELWDFLSGDNNTMEQILDIINAIATPEFKEKYNYLNDKGNYLRDAVRYKNQLEEWFLYRETYLLDKNEVIKEKINNSTRGKRVFIQPVFRNGSYNLNRCDYLKSLME
jgi:hypothetical protein